MFGRREKAIFGEASDYNATLYVENGSINNTFRPLFSYNGSSVTIAVTSLQKIIVLDRLDTLKINNALPLQGA